MKFGHGRLEVLEIRGIDWIDAAKDHGMDFLKARQRIECWSSRIGQVSPILISAVVLILAMKYPTSAIQARLREHLWREDADLLDFVILIRRHQLDAIQGDASGGYPDIGNHAAISVKDRIKDEASKRLVRCLGEGMR